MIPPVFTLLKDNSTVTALIGMSPVRAFPWGEAPENTLAPYVTWYVVNGLPQNHLNQAPQMDNLGTQLDVWAKSGESCVNVATAVRNALEGSGHMTRIGQMERDTETGFYRLSMDFDFFTRR